MAEISFSAAAGAAARSGPSVGQDKGLPQQYMLADEFHGRHVFAAELQAAIKSGH
jgi:hypothetical protein